MSHHRKKRGGIPEGWLDYSSVGRRLDGTRFIAFKVPLKPALNRQLSPHDAFSLVDLLDSVKDQDQELGLIIDLTYTTRYYSPQDLPESLYMVKVYTQGHVVPNDQTILSFKRAVHHFLQENAHNDKLIGVHCTHGLNRTGYLICRYLIDVDGMDPKAAVELFNSSRGHMIERVNYLEDLTQGHKRSNEGMEQPGQEPIRGQASGGGSDITDDRRTHHDDGVRSHRRSSHRSHRHDDGLLPLPPFYPPLPPPPSHHHHHQYRHPPSAPPRHPYRWTGPPPPPGPAEGSWRRAPPSGRSRYYGEKEEEEEEEDWRPRRHDDWRRRRDVAPLPPPPPLKRYTPHWANGSEGGWERDRPPHRPDPPHRPWSYHRY